MTFMEGANNFRWPDCPPYPPPSWWEVRGLELGLDPDQIKFAGALVTLGGPDSRNNSMAGSLAGMTLTRTAAFRLARSVKVRKLINEAEETKTGKREPLTEAQIDERIDKMIASPNDLAAAKGIELRERRKALREERERDQEPNPLEFLAKIAEIDPIKAARMAAQTGAPLPPLSLQTLSKFHCRECTTKIARELGIELVEQSEEVNAPQ